MANERDKRIKEVIAEQLTVDIKKVIPLASWDDLGADSLDVIEVVMAIEEEFGCEISSDDADKITTVQDCLDYAEKNNIGGEVMP